MITYLFYLILAAALVVYTGGQCYHHGAVFLLDIFNQEEETARTVNRLLLMGYYLVNLGYAVAAAAVGLGATEPYMQVVQVAKHLGTLALILGALHLFNLVALSLIQHHFTRNS